MMQDSKIQNRNQLIPKNKNPNLPDHRIDDQEEILPNTTGSYEVSDPYVTSFVCLLIPRFEEHILIGDLVDNLHTWMKDICISFGWNIKFIEISPNYLHWIMTVKIDSSPVEFMNIVRTTTSKKYLMSFQGFQKRTCPKDFGHYFIL